MVIFHSYVSLPEGKWSQNRVQVSPPKSGFCPKIWFLKGWIAKLGKSMEIPQLKTQTKPTSSEFQGSMRPNTAKTSFKIGKIFTTEAAAVGASCTGIQCEPNTGAPMFQIVDCWWLLMIVDYCWWLLMIVDDCWLLLMIVDDCWWLSMIVDDCWWLLMIVDDCWWLLMIVDDWDCWWLLMIVDDWVFTWNSPYCQPQNVHIHRRIISRNIQHGSPLPAQLQSHHELHGSWPVKCFSQHVLYINLTQ